MRLQHAAVGTQMASAQVYGLLFGDETGIGLSDSNGKAMLTASMDSKGNSSVSVAGTLVVGNGIRLGGDVGITATADGSLQVDATSGVRIYNPKTKETVISLGSDGAIKAKSVAAARFIPTDVVLQNGDCATEQVGAIARDTNGVPMVCSK